MIPADLLRRLRNDLPMPVTIATLGRDGPRSKVIEGYFRFDCPGCGEMRATINPRTNLAHCFCCHQNFNTIDLLTHRLACVPRVRLVCALTPAISNPKKLGTNAVITADGA